MVKECLDSIRRVADVYTVGVGAALPHLSTTVTARDMDAIRSALGETGSASSASRTVVKPSTRPCPHTASPACCSTAIPGRGTARPRSAAEPCTAAPPRGVPRPDWRPHGTLRPSGALRRPRFPYIRFRRSHREVCGWTRPRPTRQPRGSARSVAGEGIRPLTPPRAPRRNSSEFTYGRGTGDSVWHAHSWSRHATSRPMPRVTTASTCTPTSTSKALKHSGAAWPRRSSTPAQPASTVPASAPSTSRFPCHRQPRPMKARSRGCHRLSTLSYAAATPEVTGLFPASPSYRRGLIGHQGRPPPLSPGCCRCALVPGVHFRRSPSPGTWPHTDRSPCVAHTHPLPGRPFPSVYVASASWPRRQGHAIQTECWAPVAAAARPAPGSGGRAALPPAEAPRPPNNPRISPLRRATEPGPSPTAGSVSTAISTPPPASAPRATPRTAVATRTASVSPTSVASPARPRTASSSTPPPAGTPDPAPRPSSSSTARTTLRTVPGPTRASRAATAAEPCPARPPG